MKKCISLGALVGMALWACLAASAQSQQASSDQGVSTRVVVTAEPKKGDTVPVINQGDVLVYQGKTRDKVTEWIPATGDHATLDLFILIDDSSTENLGSQLDDIRKFIEGQPDTTRIGIAYMQNGTAESAVCWCDGRRKRRNLVIEIR